MTKRSTPTNQQVLAWSCLAVGLAAMAWLLARPRRRGPVRDYSDRSGLPRSANDMRGAARSDFRMPDDMATPAPLRPLVSP